MRKVNSARHDERRAQILDAAMRCFQRDGFRGASISDICASAGISPGHLYHYFSSKEAIVAAIIEVFVTQAAARFEQIGRAGDVIESLIAEVDQVDDGSDDCDEALGLELLAEAARNPAIAELVERHSARLSDVLAAQLRRGQLAGQIPAAIEPDRTAMLLIHVIDTLGAIGLRDRTLGRPMISEMRKQVIRKLLTP